MTSNVRIGEKTFNETTMLETKKSNFYLCWSALICISYLEKNERKLKANGKSMLSSLPTKSFRQLDDNQ